MQQVLLMLVFVNKAHVKIAFLIFQRTFMFASDADMDNLP